MTNKCIAGCGREWSKRGCHHYGHEFICEACQWNKLGHRTMMDLRSLNSTRSRYDKAAGHGIFERPDVWQGLAERMARNWAQIRLELGIESQFPAGYVHFQHFTRFLR